MTRFKKNYCSKSQRKTETNWTSSHPAKPGVKMNNWKLCHESQKHLKALTTGLGSTTRCKVTVTFTSEGCSKLLNVTSSGTPSYTLHHFIQVSAIHKAQFRVFDEVLNETASHRALFICHKPYSLYWPDHASTDTCTQTRRHCHAPLIHF